MTGDATAVADGFLHRSRSTSCPDCDLITSRLGVNAFAFAFRGDNSPLDAVGDVGACDVDEPFERVDVCVWGEDVE